MLNKQIESISCYKAADAIEIYSTDLEETFVVMHKNKTLATVMAEIENIFKVKEFDADDYVTYKIGNGPAFDFTTIDHLSDKLRCILCKDPHCDLCIID